MPKGVIVGAIKSFVKKIEDLSHREAMYSQEA